MKTNNISKYIFGIIGAGLLILSLFNFIKTVKFLESAITSKGEVIDVLVSHPNSSSSNSVCYTPLVQFIDKKGTKIKFSSSFGDSSPPSYDVGEKVEVLYNPESPNDAEIKSFMPIWGGVSIYGLFGIIFFGVSAKFFISDKKKNNLLEFLHQNGTRIESVFQDVDINMSHTVNSSHPYQIISQWQNPATSKLHIFFSDDIWFDPTDYIKSDKIKVLIDINNPEKYHVDLSFLPQKAK